MAQRAASESHETTEGMEVAQELLNRFGFHPHRPPIGTLRSEKDVLLKRMIDLGSSMLRITPAPKLAKSSTGAKHSSRAGPSHPLLSESGKRVTTAKKYGVEEPKVVNTKSVEVKGGAPKSLETKRNTHLPNPKPKSTEQKVSIPLPVDPKLLKPKTASTKPSAAASASASTHSSRQPLSSTKHANQSTSDRSAAGTKKRGAGPTLVTLLAVDEAPRPKVTPVSTCLPPKLWTGGWASAEWERAAMMDERAALVLSGNHQAPDPDDVHSTVAPLYEASYAGMIGPPSDGRSAKATHGAPPTSYPSLGWPNAEEATRRDALHVEVRERSAMSAQERIQVVFASDRSSRRLLSVVQRLHYQVLHILRQTEEFQGSRKRRRVHLCIQKDLFVRDRKLIQPLDIPSAVSTPLAGPETSTSHLLFHLRFDVISAVACDPSSDPLLLSHGPGAMREAICATRWAPVFLTAPRSLWYHNPLGENSPHPLAEYVVPSKEAAQQWMKARATWKTHQPSAGAAGGLYCGAVHPPPPPEFANGSSSASPSPWSSSTYRDPMNGSGTGRTAQSSRAEEGGGGGEAVRVGFHVLLAPASVSSSLIPAISSSPTPASSSASRMSTGTLDGHPPSTPAPASTRSSGTGYINVVIMDTTARPSAEIIVVLSTAHQRKKNKEEGEVTTARAPRGPIHVKITRFR